MEEADRRGNVGQPRVDEDQRPGDVPERNVDERLQSARLLRTRARLVERRARCTRCVNASRGGPAPTSGTNAPTSETNAPIMRDECGDERDGCANERDHRPDEQGARTRLARRRASPRDARVLHARDAGRPRDPGSEGRGRYAVEHDGHADRRNRHRHSHATSADDSLAGVCALRDTGTTAADLSAGSEDWAGAEANAATALIGA